MWAKYGLKRLLWTQWSFCYCLCQYRKFHKNTIYSMAHIYHVIVIFLTNFRGICDHFFHLVKVKCHLFILLANILKQEKQKLSLWEHESCTSHLWKITSYEHFKPLWASSFYTYIKHTPLVTSIFQGKGSKIQYRIVLCSLQMKSVNSCPYKHYNLLQNTYRKPKVSSRLGFFHEWNQQQPWSFAKYVFSI